MHVPTWDSLKIKYFINYIYEEGKSRILKFCTLLLEKNIDEKQFFFPLMHG